MSAGRIVEMQTGEGKTLTATIPAALHAWEGRPVLIATANDYLARRDAESLRPVYAALGLSVGCIQSGQSREERQSAYARHITYGTAREFGFDFLRDRLEERRREDPRTALFASGPRRVQRDPACLILDEADSLLIDEARTPLILSGTLDRADAAHEAGYRWAAASAPVLHEEDDYRRDPLSGWPGLTTAGRARVRTLAMPAAMASLTLTDVHHFLERALFVNARYQRDRHYVVREGQVQIVDEFTGRIQTGRTWNDGIHQAVEAREGVPLTIETGHLARVTMQEFVRRFPVVAGMTGTAREAAAEFRTAYGLQVRTIPPHRRLRRRRWPDAVFADKARKYAAVAREIAEVRDAGRAVLVGTPTIAASQALADVLSGAGIEHVVLSALNPEEEAGIVALAGQSGRVTVATNMAGRGTDIRLQESVRDAGGLHVIATELHAARRIDRQLEGRCGRQGDPGTYRQFLSLEDDLLTAAFGEEAAERLRSKHTESVNAGGVIALLRRAQRRIEREHRLQRQELLQFDRELHRATQALGLDPVLDAVG